MTARKDVKKDKIKRNIPWFESGGKIYLEVTTSDNKVEFVHTENDELIFSSQEFDNSDNIVVPVPLLTHRDSGVVIPIVGIPRKEDLEMAKVLPILGIYKKIKLHLNRYIDAPDIDVDMFTFFIFFTWFYPKMNTVPYLRILGDTGKGKSRFLKVIADLCFYPIVAEGASTASGIMRFNEKWHGTLKIDEADLRDGGAENELVKYLNLGFEKDHFLIKTDKTDPKVQETFDPFCPKLFAMREPFKDNATEGRLFSFSPTETQRKDIPFILPPTYDEEVYHLRAIITRYVLHIWEQVDGSKMMDCSSLEIEPRLKQLAMPLSIVLQLMPDGEERFISYLTRRQQEVKKTRAQSFEGTVFNSLLLFATGTSDSLGDDYRLMMRRPETERYITSDMVADSLGLKSATVTRALKSIGFDVVNSRFGEKTTRHVVVPSPKAWDEIIQRYYFTDESKEKGDRKMPCPLCLKGPHYCVTHVSDVTLPSDTPIPS